MDNIYSDIAKRTNGDIYIGVVGPVRTGKSTFISQFIKRLILPHISDKQDKKRIVDEMPQSADGKTIMTSQISFVPNNAVTLTFDDKSSANFRLIDCVGYVVDGAEGLVEDGKSRLVNTPWSNDPMPFEQAAEEGTRRVVHDHSTVAIVVTTDGTIGQIDRQSYISAEERVIKELQQQRKPFIVVLNTKTPNSEGTQQLVKLLEQKYKVTVIAVNVATADTKTMEGVVQCILKEFPVRRIAINLPKWIRALDKENDIVCDLLNRVKSGMNKVIKMKDAPILLQSFEGCKYMQDTSIAHLSLGNGVAEYQLTPNPNLFFEVLSSQANTNIDDEFALMSFVTQSAFAKSQYESLKDAFIQADKTGYGVVSPQIDKMTVDEPQLSKQGGVFAVKLRATAPSYHIIKVDVATEVAPMVGTEQQGQYLLSEYRNNPQAIWNTNMFGKTMASLAQEGLSGKSSAVPNEIKHKLCKTLDKIVNENRGGLFCLIL